MTTRIVFKLVRKSEICFYIVVCHCFDDADCEPVISADERQLLFQLTVHGQLNFSFISEFLSELKIGPFTPSVTTRD